MKNFKLGQILRSAAKKSTLLVVALLSFQVVASKMPTQSKKSIAKKYVKPQVAPEQISSALVENDSYKKTVEVEPLVDVRTNQLEDGTVVETKTTIEPDVENGTVKTTVEEWTMYDYVKAGAIGAGVLGAVGLGIAYQDQIAEKFNDGASQLNDWWAGEQKSVVNENSVEAILDKKIIDWTTQDVEVLKNVMLKRKDYKALDMLSQKFNNMTPEEKRVWAEKNAHLAAMGAAAGGLIGGLGGGAKGAQVGAVVGTGLGGFKGAQMLRAGGSPKAVAGKVAMGALQGALVGTGAGATFGTAVGVGMGGTAGLAVGLGSDLINTMDVPADYKVGTLDVEIIDKVKEYEQPAHVLGVSEKDELVSSDTSLLASPFVRAFGADRAVVGGGIAGAAVKGAVLNNGLGVIKGAQHGAAMAQSSLGLYGAGALAGTGTFLYSNVNPATAQNSIDATDQNIDAGQLYQ